MKRIKITQTSECKVFFTSDLHINHKNIVSGETSWAGENGPFKDWENKESLKQFCDKYGTRPFRSSEEMDYVILKNINDMVGENDILFNLGDFSFGKSDPRKIRERIICRNIFSTCGNHDRKLDGSIFDCFEPALEAEIDDTLVCMSHYKHFIWNKKHRFSIHTYGHSHSKLEHIDIGRSIDVGVDNAYKLFMEFRPFSFDEIKKMLENRDVNYLAIEGTPVIFKGDHHVG